MKRKRRTKKRTSEPPSLKARQQKVRMLQQMADDLKRGEHFNVTRLAAIPVNECVKGPV
jgi:hypothetical protein